MNIGFEAFDVDNFSIDPLIFGVFNIYILPQIKLEIIFLAEHTLIKNNYKTNTLSHSHNNKYFTTY